jgi:hypothetical protein
MGGLKASSSNSPMKKLSSATTVIYLCLLGLSGCGHKTDAKTELDKAAEALGKADASAQATAPSPGPTAPAVAESPTAAPAAILPTGNPAQQMQQAIAAYKAGELEDAVTRLQKLRAMSALTPQQRMALQDSIAAVMTEIYGQAAKGDPRAIQAVKQYEEMQTSHQ